MESLYIKNLDVIVNAGDLVGIVGANASGKTVLLKKIMGRLYSDDIYLDDKLLKEYDISFKKNNIVCVFDDNLYNTSNVFDELNYYLKRVNILNVNERINDFIKIFSLDNLKDKEFINLSIEDRVFIKILSLLIINPLLICIDDLLTYLSLDKKIKILNYIKENNMTLLCVCSDIEELLLLDKVLLISKGNKVLFDTINIVFNNEDLFKDNGLSLPFIYELNNLLKSYDLIKDNHIVYKELVDILWK